MYAQGPDVTYEKNSSFFYCFQNIKLGNMWTVYLKLTSLLLFINAQ